MERVSSRVCPATPARTECPAEPLNRVRRATSASAGLTRETCQSWFHPTEYSVHVAGRKYPKGSDHSDLYRIRKIADTVEEWLKRLLEERTDYWELD